MNWLFRKTAIARELHLGSLAKRISPGLFAACAIVVGSGLGIGRPLEQIAYTALFRLRGELPWDERVVVVTIDNPSIKQLGRFPWDRQRYATLLKVLSETEASVVVFDILFSEESPEDKQLVAAIQELSGRLVLAQAPHSTGVSLLPTRELQQAASIAEGHIRTDRDNDGVTRSIVPCLARGSENECVPALSIAAASSYSLTTEIVKLPDLNKPLWINWPGKVERVGKYSFAEVVRGKVPNSKFRDKIVLVGVTADGFDPLYTPFDRNPAAGGVYLHAAAIDNLLKQNFLHKLDDFWQMLLILPLGGPLLSFTLTRRGTTFQLVVFGTICTSWLILSFLLFNSGYLILVAVPIVLFSLTCLPVVVYDRLKLEVANRELQRQATTDGLTGLANRRRFDEYLDREWRRLAREQKPLSLILCDVDFFKKYNDRYGHQGGDDCLRQVAGAIRLAVKRPTDLAARYGGEEFAVILPNISEQGAIHIAEAVRSQVKALKIPHAASQAGEYVSLSLGVASTIPHSDANPATLIAFADSALYQAKAEGRDRVISH